MHQHEMVPVAIMVTANDPLYDGSRQTVAALTRESVQTQVDAINEVKGYREGLRTDPATSEPPQYVFPREALCRPCTLRRWVDTNDGNPPAARQLEY